MKKFFSLSHSSVSYQISLDMSETRSKDFLDAVDQIDTDQIRLLVNKRVGDYRLDFERYRKQGGRLKPKKYLDQTSFDNFGASWNDAINYAKKQMITEFRSKMDWTAYDDQLRLLALADSGHAMAAYLIGRTAARKGLPQSVEWFVNSHNYGHIGALFILSGHLVKEGNAIGALTCLIISSDKGCDLALLAMCHYEKIELMLKSDSDKLDAVLEQLQHTSKYSTARYYKFFKILLSGDEREAFLLLNNIISHPYNPPKDNEKCEQLDNREKTIRDFFESLRNELWISGKLVSVSERLNLLRTISARYLFSTYKDYEEIEEHVGSSLQKATDLDSLAVKLNNLAL